MDEAEREAFIERVSRQSATVGASLPERITVDGTDIELRAFVVETRKLERIPQETEATLDAAKRTLRTERAERFERLESAPLNREAAATLTEEIIGIDRALNALETIRRPDYGDEAGAAVVEDHKRWLDFVEALS